MSDEGRAYAKLHSPLKGARWLYHYALGDLANAAHGYRICVSDEHLVAEWPGLTVDVIERARAALVKSGHLRLIKAAAQGNKAVFQFVFKDHDDFTKPLVAGSNPQNADGSVRDLRIGEPSHLLMKHEVRTSSAENENDDPLRGFEEFWKVYPRRNGKIIGRGLCERRWAKMDIDDKRAAWRGARHYSAAVTAGLTIAKDPDRWLRDELWEDWQTPAIPDVRRSTQESRGFYDEHGNFMRNSSLQ